MYRWCRLKDIKQILDKIEKQGRDKNSLNNIKTCEA